MQRAFLTRAATAALLTLTLSGCAAEQRLTQASIDLGVAQADKMLPELPAECRTREPHAALIRGVDPVIILDRERAAVDRANDSKLRCADFMDSVIAGLKNNEEQD